MSFSLDLGSGANPRNPFDADEVQGIDVFYQDSPRVLEHDLMNGTIPITTNFCDYVTAYDFIEHVPREGYRLVDNSSLKSLKIERFFPFIDLMSEIWRVLKPGGIFHAVTPVYPFKEAFRDPQHVNIISDDTWEYFAGSMLGLTQHYGFKGTFKMQRPQEIIGTHAHWYMEAVK